MLPSSSPLLWLQSLSDWHIIHILEFVQTWQSLSLCSGSLALLISGVRGLSNLRSLLGKDYERPALQEADIQVDLTFRGDILGDAVLVAAREVDSQRARDEQGKTATRITVTLFSLDILTNCFWINYRLARASGELNSWNTELNNKAKKLLK